MIMYVHGQNRKFQEACIKLQHSKAQLNWVCKPSKPFAAQTRCDNLNMALGWSPVSAGQLTSFKQMHIFTKHSCCCWLACFCIQADVLRKNQANVYLVKHLWV